MILNQKTVITMMAVFFIFVQYKKYTIHNEWYIFYHLNDVNRY